MSTLAYASPGTVMPRIDWPFRVAYFCAISPLTTGVLTTVAAMLTRSAIFGQVGMYTLLVGPILFLAGMVLLFVSRHGQERGRYPRRDLIALGFLLLVNWPAAICCLFIGINALAGH